ncbi:Ku protein [Longimicrobium sp.]|uniref:non-homologous end joining protein Ku n=1 Tax=Longimicrobium sp. TaxID=2029185 RepID=UPI003B3B4EE1
MPEWDEDDGGQEAVTRSFWSGTITFGLVSIPVALYAANRSQRVSLRMVSPEGTPLTRRYFTTRDDRELDSDDIVRGYEIEKDRFVIADDDELERLAPERTRDIDLRQFVDASEIDPMYFERAYYLTPNGQSTKAYRLLARVMEETGRAGIATFVMRTKEYLVAILAENGILRAETLRFADELRSAADIGLPEAVEPDAAAVKRMDREIGKQVEARLDTRELEDHSADRLMKVVRQKVRSGDDVVHLDESEQERSSDVIDLMEILKRRLQGTTEEEDTPPTSRTAAKPKPAGKKPRKTASKPSSTSSSKTSKASSAKKPAKPSAGARKDADLAASSKTDLLKRAQKLDIPGRSGMSKDELVKAIRRGA